MGNAKSKWKQMHQAGNVILQADSRRRAKANKQGSKENNNQANN